MVKWMVARPNWVRVVNVMVQMHAASDVRVPECEAVLLSGVGRLVRRAVMVWPQAACSTSLHASSPVVSHY